MADPLNFDINNTIQGILDGTDGMLATQTPVIEPSTIEPVNVQFDSEAQLAGIDSDLEQVHAEMLGVQEGLTSPVEPESQSFKQQMVKGLPFLAMIATAKTQDQLNRAVMGYTEVRQQAQQHAANQALRKQNAKFQAAQLMMQPLTAREANLSQAARDIRQSDVTIKVGNADRTFRSNLATAEFDQQFKMSDKGAADTTKQWMLNSGVRLNELVVLEDGRMERLKQQLIQQTQDLGTQLGNQKELAKLEHSLRNENALAMATFNSYNQSQRDYNNSVAAQPHLVNILEVPAIEKTYASLAGAHLSVKSAMKEGEFSPEVSTAKKGALAEMTDKPITEVSADFLMSANSAEFGLKQFESFSRTALRENPSDGFKAQEDAVREFYREIFDSPQMELEVPDDEQRKTQAVAHVKRALDQKYGSGIPKHVSKILEDIQQRSTAGFFEQLGGSGLGAPENADPLSLGLGNLAAPGGI